MEFQVVFIGFGEAAYHIAKGLKGEGFESMAAYDVGASVEKTGFQIRERAQKAGVHLFETLELAYASAHIIVSLTSAQVALEVAESVVPNLIAGQVYVDMNSAGPKVKRAIDQVQHVTGVKFCDVGVMGTVPGNGHKVPMFAAGEGADTFYQSFSKYGMRISVLEAPAGGASAIKMLKSVVMKGLPQLMFESFEAAQKYGVLDTLVSSLSESLNGKTVEQLADTFIARTMIHAERRGAEVRDVIDTLEEVHVDASMSKAALKKLEHLAEQNWRDKMGPDGSKLDYKAALKMLCSEEDK